MHTKRSRLRVESLEARDVPALPSAAPSLGPPPPASATAIWVNTAAQLHAAVDNLQSGQTIVVQPGTYQLTRPLYVGLGSPVSNVTIRGATDNFGDVVIRGFGMDDNRVTYGVGVFNAQNVTVANVSIGDVYYDAVDIKGEAGARQVRVYHCRLFDTGEQIVKSNTGGGLGADNCAVEYSVLEYTAGPSTVDHGGGTGYTNGISAHRVAGWQVRHNLFRNFHTPDSSANTFNPVVLMWNGSRDTVVEGNTFVDCDRAIALGLIDRTGPDDHQGGVVRNNFVYQRPGLFTAARRAASDGQVLVYDSPGTQVYHNTVLTNGNSVVSIEVRWANAGVAFDNNLADAPFRARDGGDYSATGNYLAATPAMFRAPVQADLHLVDGAATRASVIDRAPPRAGATTDFDGDARPTAAAADVGADEFVPAGPRVTSVDVSGGTAQRSRVASVSVNFSTQVTFGQPTNIAAAFRLTRVGGESVGGFTATASVVGGVTVVTLSNFTGAETVGGSLVDGRYTVTVLAAQVSAGGVQLDGDGNGTGGDNYVLTGTATNKLFRYYGDGDGDGDVDGSDLVAFVPTLFNAGAYTAAADFDGDGDVDGTDLFEFVQNLFVPLP